MKFEIIFRKLFLTRPFLAITAALILGPAAFLFFECYYSPDVPFIFHHSGASWIMHPTPIFTVARGYPSEVDFSREFTYDRGPIGQVFVHLIAFKEVKLYVNEFPISTKSLQGINWKKETQIQISQWIRRGTNSIRAHVRNPMGPALLWLKIGGLKDSIVTDETWKVRIESAPFVQAILADDTRLNPDSRTVPTPTQSFIKKGRTIFWIFVASIGLWGIGRFFFQGHRMKILPRTALVGIMMVWIYLFLGKTVKIDSTAGFDLPGHLDYIFYIIKNRTIPLPTEGWSMFHPPFFYLLSAGFLEILNPLFSLVRPFQVLKIIPFICGVGNIWVAYAFGRMIFRDNPVRIFFLVLMAGILPMNIYMSAYVGNEPLNAFLVSLSLLMVVYIFRSPETRASQMIYLGLLLGLALLTKITAWAILPVVVVFLAFKMIRIDQRKLKDVASKLGLLLLVIIVISGWYYVRNIIHFGRPFMINWNLPGQQWWQDPGFHMIQYFLGFGETLRHPYFSCFHSFWDSIYSTFWGDGMIGGKAFLIGRPAVWNYDYMSAVYILALPATGIFCIGLFKAVQRALRDKEASSRLIIVFLIISLYSVGFFILFGTLKVPIYSQAKAFYGLSAMGPISVIFALGLGAVHNWLASPRLLVGRAIFYGWFGTLISVIYLSFGA